jgi:hypothetical protein
MQRLYYIIALSVSKSGNTAHRAKLVFVTFQWLFFFACPILTLDKLSLSGKIDWYNYNQVKPFLLWATLLVIFLNYFLLFRKKQTNKIIDKYTGRYPLIDKYPIGAYFLFHFLLPLLFFIIFIFIPRCLDRFL